jgi:hypothetical protein
MSIGDEVAPVCMADNTTSLKENKMEFCFQYQDNNSRVINPKAESIDT